VSLLRADLQPAGAHAFRVTSLIFLAANGESRISNRLAYLAVHKEQVRSRLPRCNLGQT